MSAENLGVFLSKDPLDDLRSVRGNKVLALGLERGREDTTDLLQGRFDLGDGSVAGNVVGSKGDYQLTESADLVARDALDLVELGGRAQTNLGAEGLWVLVGKDPLDKLRSVLLNKESAGSVVRRREGRAELLQGTLNLSYGSVVGKVVLSETYDQGANAAASSGLDLLDLLDLGGLGAQTNVSAELLGVFLVENPLDKLGSILINKDSAGGVVRRRKDRANVVQLILDLSNGVVVGDVVLDIGNNQLANAASGRSGNLNLLNLGSAEVDLSAELLRVFVVLNPLYKLGQVGVDELLALRVVRGRKERARSSQSGFDLGKGGVAGKVALNERDDHLTKAARRLGNLLGVVDLVVGLVVDLGGGAQTNLGAEGLRVFLGDQPVDESRDLLLNKGVAVRREVGWENGAKLLDGSLELSEGSVAGKIVLSERNNQLTNTAARSRLNLAGMVNLGELGSAQTKLGADVVNLVGDYPLDDLRCVLGNDGVALSLSTTREEGTDLVQSSFNLADSSVVADVALYNSHNHLANAARGSLALNTRYGDLDGSRAQVKFLANNFRRSLVNDPLNELRSVLVNLLGALRIRRVNKINRYQSVVRGGQKAASIVQPVNNLSLSSVVLDVAFNSLDDELAERASCIGLHGLRRSDKQESEKEEHDW